MNSPSLFNPLIQDVYKKKKKKKKIAKESGMKGKMKVDEVIWGGTNKPNIFSGLIIEGLYQADIAGRNVVGVSELLANNEMIVGLILQVLKDLFCDRRGCGIGGLSIDPTHQLDQK